MSDLRANSIDRTSWPSLRLAHGSNSIRVLSIEPARSEQEDDPPRCRLETTTLENPGDYEALSYAWGFERPTEHIFINDFAFPVSPTLKSALLRIRQHWDNSNLLCGEQRPKLWVDALCIDQSDTDEKSKQVALMGTVYETAKCVLVWLGEPDNEADSETARLLSSPEDSVRDADDYYLFAVLTNKAWFSRRWVVQEVLSSNTHWGLLGDYIFPMSALIKRLDRFSSTAWSWRPSELTRKRTLLEYLITCSRTLCSNDVDRVYALLGISSDKASFTVNYRLNWLQVFADVASFYAQTLYLPVLLVCAIAFRPAVRPISDRSMPRPSWVPDWRAYDSTSFHFGTRKSNIEQLFSEPMEFVTTRYWDEEAEISMRYDSTMEINRGLSSSISIHVSAWTQTLCEHVDTSINPKCLHCCVCDILKSQTRTFRRLPDTIRQDDPSGTPRLRMPDLYCFLGYGPVIFGLFKTDFPGLPDCYKLAYFFAFNSGSPIVDEGAHCQGMSDVKRVAELATRIELSVRLDWGRTSVQLEMTPTKFHLV